MRVKDCVVSRFAKADLRRAFPSRAISVFVCVFLVWLAPSAQSSEPSPYRDGLGLLEAVQTSLDRNPQIQIKKEALKSSKGSLMQATGEFDVTFNASADREDNSTPLTNTQREAQGGIEHLDTSSTTISAAVGKQTRYGVSVQAKASMSQTDNPTINPDKVNEGTILFAVKVPILRGWGVEAAAAEEMAAVNEIIVSEYNLSHTISKQILSVVSAYWEYLSAAKTLELRKKIEMMSRRMFDDITALVRADERPASDLAQFEASLAEDTASRLSAEQALIETRRALGIAMGISADEIRRLPAPSDDFPRLNEAETQNLKGSTLFENALVRRADLLSMAKQRDSATVLLEKARRDTLPQLDLGLDLNYAGLYEGSDGFDISSYGDNQAGPGMKLSLSFGFPAGNRVLRGALIQREAALRQVNISSEDLNRSILSAILEAMASLRNSVTRLGFVGHSVRLYREALDSELLKLKLGVATALDVLNMQDRLNLATLNEITARQSVARDIIRLRFEAGMIITPGAGGKAVKAEQLISIVFN